MAAIPQLTEMTAQNQRFINELMLKFRDLVVQIEEEEKDLNQKLNDLFDSPVQPNSLASTQSSSSPSSSTSALLAVTASPTIDEPSAATNTSSGAPSITTATTGSSKPPSYKTAIKPKDIVIQIPQRPPRTRSRATLPRLNDDRRQVDHPQNIRNSSSHRRTLDTQTSHSMSSNGVARGALIVLEGLDRVGKSTLANKLVEHLERIRKPVTYCRFPDRSTPIGQLIDGFLRNSKKIDDHAMHLLFSANRWELDNTIRQTLARGTTIVMDRYSYSGIAYSSAKKGLSMDWCRNTEKGLPKPDLVIYLELPKEAQYKRPGFGDERFETQELQELIRNQYEKVIESSQDNWIRIDVENKSSDQVLGEIIIPVKRCIESHAGAPIRNLAFT